jgi:hypothetical protein
MSARRKRKHIVKPANARYRFACTRSMCMALPFVTCTVRRSGGAIMNVAGRGMVPARLLRDDFTNLGRGPQEF